MSRKKILLFIVLPIVVSCILLTALILASVSQRFAANREKINSDLKNLSINELTDEEVVQMNLFSSYKSHIFTSGNKSHVKNNNYKDTDYDKCQFHCESIKGFKTISASQAEQSTLKLSISSTISSGKGKIAIIQNDKVIEYIPFGENTTRSYEISEESLFLVKIICEDAKVDITVKRTITPKD